MSDNKLAQCHTITAIHDQSSFLPSSRFTEEVLHGLIQSMQTSVLDQTSTLGSRNIVFQPQDIEDSRIASTILQVSSNRLRSEEFRMFLEHRIPLVITGLNNKLRLAWSPAQLTEDFGSQSCTMEDCEGVASSVRTTLGNFLSYFGKENNGVIWKVKVSTTIFLTRPL